MAKFQRISHGFYRSRTVFGVDLNDSVNKGSELVHGIFASGMNTINWLFHTISAWFFFEIIDIWQHDITLNVHKQSAFIYMHLVCLAHRLIAL